jgi:hypothetical protein
MNTGLNANVVKSRWPMQFDILAYVGNGLWIQADPGIGSVATLNGRTSNNRWFDTPVTTHRWQLLAQPISNSQ